MNTIKNQELVLIFLFIVFLFAICKYFWNVMSAVTKSNRYLEAQTKLLAELTVKMGTDVNTVSDILAQAGVKKIKL